MLDFGSAWWDYFFISQITLKDGTEMHIFIYISKCTSLMLVSSHDYF